VNDAYFRLAYFNKHLQKLEQNHAERVVAFLDAQKTKRENEPNTHTAWDNAYEAASDAFKKMSATK
jgi:hypothetical protein